MGNKLDKFDEVLCAFSKVDKFIGKISNKNATVLLTGNSGSGKSRLAKIIHKNSNRKDENFIEIHCTTLPSHLLESELFGHVKGAFTGASDTKMGKVQAADKGTLFLDEIGELSLEGQAKLLRLIQDKVICKIGSNTDIKVDTRIILATNRNLKKMVEENKFREDLYYRINMFECALPDLSDNKKEVDRLIRLFVKEHSTNKEYLISNDLYIKLMEYHWPGNIRELKNVIERLCFLAEDEMLSVKDLPEYILNNNSSNIKISQKTSDFISDSVMAKLSLKELEKRYILSTIENEPNYDKACEILGITKVTLWRKRKEYFHHLH